MNDTWINNLGNETSIEEPIMLSYIDTWTIVGIVFTLIILIIGIWIGIRTRRQNLARLALLQQQSQPTLIPAGYPYNDDQYQAQMQGLYQQPQEIVRCVICFEKMNSTTICQLLTCGHQFHQKCITELLKLRLTCPTCNLPAQLYQQNPNQTNQQYVSYQPPQEPAPHILPYQSS